MSFGFGVSGAQGTVRYALMVDDAQATQSINRFKSNVNTLNLPTSQLSTNMGKLNSTFAAGVTPLKSQGDALTTLKNNLNATGTTATTLGTKIKDTASKFAGFATGLAVTASGVLQLAAGFRDYGDAQIAVDKATRKLSLAQEAHNKALDKLKSLNDAGIKSGKEYAQAQLDVKQAQEGLAIAEQLVGERQEDMFDAQSQFVASVIPTTLGAIGTLGSAFKDLGGAGGLGGLVGKFKDFGGGIKGSVIPAISGLMGSGGLGGLTDKFKSAIDSVGGFKGALLGIGVPAFAGIAGGLLILQDVNATMDKLAAVGLKFTRTSSTIFDTKSVDQLNKSTAELDEVLKRTHASLLELRLAPEAVMKRFVEAGGKIDKFGNIVVTVTDKIVKSTVDLSNAEKKLDADETALANKKKERQTTSVKQEVEHLEAVVKDDKAEVARLKTVQKVNDLKSKTIALTQDELNILSRRKEAMDKARQQDIDVAAALGEVISKTQMAAADAKRQADAVTQLDTALTKTIPNLTRFAEGSAGSAEAMGLVNDMLKLAKDRTPEWNAAIDELAIHNQEAEASFKSLAKTMKNDLEKAANDAKTAIDKMRGNVESGLDKVIEAFHKVHKKGKLDFETNFDKAKKQYDKFLAEVGDKLDHGGSENAKKYIVAFEKKGTEGMSKSQKRIFQPIFDWIEKHKDEPPTVFMSGFLQQLATYEPDVSQQFQKLINPSIGLAGEIGKKAGAEFSAELMDAINSTLKIADKFANQGGHPGRGSLKNESITPPTFSGFGPGAGFDLDLSGGGKGKKKKGKNVQSTSDTGISPFMNEFTQFAMQNDYWNRVNNARENNKPSAIWGTQQGDVIGDDPLLMGKLENPFFRNKPVSSGGVGAAQNMAQKMPVLTMDTSKALQALGVVATNIQNLAKIIPVITVNNAKAIQAAGIIALRINDLTKIQPIITLLNDKAIKAIDVIAKRIMDLTKVNPVIVVKNEKAIKAVDVIAKRIDDLAKVNPTLKVKNNEAIKAVDVIAKRIQGLENINPTIKVKFTGSGTLKAEGSASLTSGGKIFIAQRGMHEFLKEDATILAHAGERVDIGKAEPGKDDRRGGGGGPIFIENHTHIGDKEFVRTVRAEMGKARYRFGMG